MTKRKSPARVAAGRINGIKSGKARRRLSREHHRTYVITTADRRIVEGLCIDCGEKPPLGDQRRCVVCATAHSQKARAYYWANAEKCREYSTARYHALNPTARYTGPRKKAA